MITHKQQTVPKVRGDPVLQLTENHETLTRKASEQAAYARTTALLPYEENTENQGVLDIRDYKQYEPIMSRSDQ